MRSHLHLLTAASVLALGLAATTANAEPGKAPGAYSDITITAADSMLPGGQDDLAPGAYGDITIVGNELTPGANSGYTVIAADTVPSTGGIENSAASEGANNRNTPDQPMSGAGSMTEAGPNSSDEGGTGIKGSADSRGATDKSTQDPGAMGTNEGASSGNAPGGTGVETSSQGEGAHNATTHE